MKTFTLNFCLFLATLAFTGLTMHTTRAEPVPFCRCELKDESFYELKQEPDFIEDYLGLEAGTVQVDDRGWLVVEDVKIVPHAQCPTQILKADSRQLRELRELKKNNKKRKDAADNDKKKKRNNNKNKNKQMKKKKKNMGNGGGDDGDGNVFNDNNGNGNGRPNGNNGNGGKDEEEDDEEEDDEELIEGVFLCPGAFAFDKAKRGKLEVESDAYFTDMLNRASFEKDPNTGRTTRKPGRGVGRGTLQEEDVDCEDLPLPILMNQRLIPFHCRCPQNVENVETLPNYCLSRKEQQLNMNMRTKFKKNKKWNRTPKN